MNQYRIWLTRSFLMAIFLVVAMVAISSCGDSTKPETLPTTLTDFSYYDINNYSDSYGELITLSTQGDTTVVLFCGETGCGFCMSQVDKIQDMIAEINTGETTNVKALMFNHANHTADPGQFYSWGVTIPALQDTLMDVGGIPTPTIKHINAIDFQDLVIVKPNQVVARRVALIEDGDNRMNLSDQSTYNQIKAWIIGD